MGRPPPCGANFAESGQASQMGGNSRCEPPGDNHDRGASNVSRSSDFAVEFRRVSDGRCRRELFVGSEPPGDGLD